MQELNAGLGGWIKEHTNITIANPPFKFLRTHVIVPLVYFVVPWLTTFMDEQGIL